MGNGADSTRVYEAGQGLNGKLLTASLEVKRMAGQINEIVHAVGILVALPMILEPDEIVESLSLAAGNAGRPFDLATNKRVAEFKFIHWQGGSEPARKKSLFKDFFYLAEFPEGKEKFLYVIDTDKPLRFLRSGSGLRSTMSGNAHLQSDFDQKYGNQFTVVREYYEHVKDRVQIVDLRDVIPELRSKGAAEPTDEPE